MRGISDTNSCVSNGTVQLSEIIQLFKRSLGCESWDGDNPILKMKWLGEASLQSLAQQAW